MCTALFPSSVLGMLVKSSRYSTVSQWKSTVSHECVIGFQTNIHEQSYLLGWPGDHVGMSKIITKWQIMLDEDRLNELETFHSSTNAIREQRLVVGDFAWQLPGTFHSNCHVLGPSTRSQKSIFQNKCELLWLCSHNNRFILALRLLNCKKANLDRNEMLD